MVFLPISGLWQITDFFALQLFLNYSTLSTNSTGDALLGPSSSFHAGIPVPHQFEFQFLTGFLTRSNSRFLVEILDNFKILYLLNEFC